MFILLLGKNGQVGGDLQKMLHPLGDLVALGRSELDLTNCDEIRSAVQKYRPGVIINAAAYTNVNQAESEQDLAMKVNGIAPGVLAAMARSHNAIYFDYSTDYVFDGLKGLPYTEDDLPSPINCYGRTKRVGELAVQSHGEAYFIIRTSWVYGLQGKNFLKTMLRLAAEKKPLRVVDDQVGSPTWSHEIARSTFDMLSWIFNTSNPYETAKAVSGIYHYAASGTTTWFGFAKSIFDSAPEFQTIKPPELIPIKSEEYPTPAKRPLFSVLGTEKIQRVFGVTPTSWTNQLAECWASG